MLGLRSMSWMVTLTQEPVFCRGSCGGAAGLRRGVVCLCVVLWCLLSCVHGVEAETGTRAPNRRATVSSGDVSGAPGGVRKAATTQPAGQQPAAEKKSTQQVNTSRKPPRSRLDQRPTSRPNPPRSSGSSALTKGSSPLTKKTTRKDIWKKRKHARFEHDLEIRMHLLTEHTGLDSGIAPELQYRFLYKGLVDIRTGLRFAPPTLGDALRYYLYGLFHLPLPLVEDGWLGIGMIHNSYGDIQKGENSFIFLHGFDMKYFGFSGGVVMRFELTRPDVFRNPVYFATEYMELFYVYDMRVKMDFVFPKLGGSRLRIGLGLMNFLDNEIVGPATGGYRMFASWDQPGVGRFGLQAGLMSYGFWAFAGFYGRWFARLSYTYHFRH